jgi:hypothetical protein
LLAVAIAGWLATGCAQVPPASPSPMPMTQTLTLQTAVQAALADASRRTGLAIEALPVTSAEVVTWSDGSLGCPQPGMMYTQALVPGFRVRLRGPGGEMDYHASTRGALVLCPAGRATPPVPGTARY